MDQTYQLLPFNKTKAKKRKVLEFFFWTPKKLKVVVLYSNLGE